MRVIAALVSLLFLFSIVSCETVHEVSKEGGTYIGKGAAAVGGITEGGAEGYTGEVTEEENPYGR